MAIDKQEAGFKFGKYKLKAICEFGRIEHLGRSYKLLLVETHDGQKYCALRLYNQNNHFIKQMCFETELLQLLALLFQHAFESKLIEKVLGSLDDIIMSFSTPE